MSGPGVPVIVHPPGPGVGAGFGVVFVVAGSGTAVSVGGFAGALSGWPHEGSSPPFLVSRTTLVPLMFVM